jgi:hypothetical protein
MIIYRGATVLRVKWEGCPQGPQAWGFLEESRLFFVATAHVYASGYDGLQTMFVFRIG